VENGSVVFQAAVGAFFRVHGGGSFHGRYRVRAIKVTDDPQPTLGMLKPAIAGDESVGA
jgi:hypothetical protein